MSESASGYWTIVEPVWDAIDIYSGPSEFLRTYDSAGQPASLLFAAHFAQSEICNGGFKQFFGNSTGVLGPEAVQGFQLIRMSETAAIVSTAMQPFGVIYPRERAARGDILESLDAEVLRTLDKRFLP